MKKFLVLFTLLAAAPAHATCNVGALPFQLQNGTPADASQVMADFNQIVNGVLANCASAGANNDITSLSALTTPLNPSQGGSNLFFGTQTTGTPTAQQLTVASNFSLTAGYRAGGIVGLGLTNTGPTTLSVNGLAANFYRKTQVGVQPMAGGELIATNPFLATYDGAEFVLEGEVQLVGVLQDWMGGVLPPPGYLVADGSTFACSTYPTLCAIIGTIYGGTGSNPALPDTRGRVMAGLDNYGTVIGAASRLTNVATGCGTAFTALGGTCANASQSHTQIIAELAAHGHTLTDPGHFHRIYVTNTGNGGGVGGFIGPGAGTYQTSNGGSQFIETQTTGITMATTGTGQAMPIVNPNLGTVKIIRY